MQQEEFPNKVAETYDPASENIKNWFEANKEVLISRNQQGSESFRTKNNFLFPYIEKEIDWTQHKTYKFKDGREVAEFPVLSEKIPIPGFLVDSVDDKSKIKIKQSVLFVKKLEGTDYSPLLVRFYSLQENIDQVSYNHIPKDWNGIIEAFGMNDGHFITFNFEDGKMVSYSKIKANEAKSLKLRNENKSSTCYTYLVENPYHMVCIGGKCTTHHQGYSVRTVCITYQPSGPGGSGPGGDSFCEEFDCYAFPGTVDLGDKLEEDKIDMEELSDCHKKIIEGLIGSTQQEFKRIFEKFNGNQPAPANYNVKFQYGVCANPNANACTSSTLVNNWSTITFNPNNLGNATDLSFARTVLHETLHAYLLFEAAYPSNCDLNCLLNSYLNRYNTQTHNNQTHHNLFVETKFLNDIATELRNYAAGVGYNVNTLGNQFFKDMAWGGLHDTDLFKTLNQSDRNRISNLLLAENTSSTQNNVSPKGIKACE